MTDKEKFDAIVERTKTEKLFVEPDWISVMVIIAYMEQMEAAGLTECGFKMTDAGKSVASICEEFDWKPSDQDVVNFVTEMADPKDRAGLAYMIGRWRDDRENLLAEFNKAKEKSKE